jgi:chemotaxis protein CheD
MIQSVGEEQAVVIGLGEMRVTDDPGVVLVCYGIGSCIAFTAFDPVSRVSGMAHFVLPDSAQGNSTAARNPVRFVDSGIHEMLGQLEAAGALRSRTVFKMAGGAHMVVAPGFASKLNIGERNVESVRATTGSAGIRVRGEDVGGAHGRTVRVFAATGKVTVSTVGGSSYEL